MDKPSEKSFGKTTKKWIIRFIKFNIIGFTVFLIATIIFTSAFTTFGAWAWLIANGAGGILQFCIISYINRTKGGQIFDSNEQKHQQENENKNQ